MQHVLVDLRYEKAYIFNNLIKCTFCNFTLLMPSYLGCPGPSPRLPPSARHCPQHIVFHQHVAYQLLAFEMTVINYFEAELKPAAFTMMVLRAL